MAPVPPPTEEQGIGLSLLVLRCQAGDERAFARLFEQFGSRTFRYLRGMVGDDADDVQQEVWLAVYNGIKRLANSSAFRTWLFRTTRHRAIDFLRSVRRERPLFEDVDVVAVESADTGDADAADLDAVGAALMAIPPTQREALVLKYWDDLSYEEIAVVVGVPIGTVRTRIHHGKKKLAELLSREDLDT